MNQLESQWQLNAAKIIFNERYSAVIPIQTSYRRFKARSWLISHLEKQPYLNPIFSDIYLAAHRPNLIFRLPKSIRDLKRVAWFSAIRIQTCVRGYRKRGLFRVKIKRVKTVQSFGRMTPIALQYRRTRILVIRIQAWIRTKITRQRFLVCKYAAVILQKSIRRFFVLQIVDQLREQNWKRIEKKLSSVLIIQNAVRKYLSILRVSELRNEVTRRYNAALLLQRNWYRKIGAFHTFMLMSCYRELEKENNEFDNKINYLERYYCARVIQRRYLIHHRCRLRYNAIEIQRWYRGRRGYCITVALRKYTYASRKLHHWARAWINLRHKMARRIQRKWWSTMSGRLLRHLEYKARLMDELMMRKHREERYIAARTVQSIVRQRQGRKAFIRHRTARRIQIAYHRYRHRKQWLEFKWQTAVQYSVKFVFHVLEECLEKYAAAEAVRRSALWDLPQAMVRGWLIRKAANNMKKRAETIRRAAAIIQKFWRNSIIQSFRLKCWCASPTMGCSSCFALCLSRQYAYLLTINSFSANEDKDILKHVINKLKSDTFASCYSLEILLRHVNTVTRKYISILDPRVGMTVSSLLHRLGLEEYADIFPKSKYIYATDLRKLSLNGLISLYETWKLKLEKESIARGTNSESIGAKKRSIPVMDLDIILQVIRPRLLTLSTKGKQSISLLTHIVELLSYSDSFVYLQNKLFDKFNNASKAQNMAVSVLSEAYKSHNYYLGLGTSCLTKGVILRCLSQTTKSSTIKLQLMNRISREYSNPDEIKMIKVRCRNCLKILEQAITEALSMLDNATHFLSRILINQANQAFQYKRRFKYLYYRRVKANDAFESWLLSTGLVTPSTTALHEAIQPTPFQLANRQFIGNSEYRDIEYSVSQCKIYLSALELLFVADSGIRILQCKYRYSAYKALVRRAKLQLFLNSEHMQYVHARKRDYVKQTWAKFRRIENVALAMQGVLYDKLNERYSIQEKLMYIPRYGWSSSFNEEAGLSYWWSHSGEESTYEMPMYTLDQWKACLLMQKNYRWHLEKVYTRREKMRLEAARLIALEEQKALRKTFNLVTLVLHTKLSHKRNAKNRIDRLMMPFILSFDEDYIIRPRMWLLMKTDHHTEKYESVLVLRVKLKKGLPVSCDLRSIDDNLVLDVSITKIFRFNLDIGSKVESRYRGLTMFYRGKVMSCRRTQSGVESVNILYDDGEFEQNVPIEFVRIPQYEADQLVALRVAFEKNLARCQKRTDHYNSVRSTRKVAQQVSVNISYTRKSILFGWGIKKEKERPVYWNKENNMTSFITQEYSARQSYAAMRIQGFCRVYIAKKKLKYLLAKYTIDFISSHAILTGNKKAFVGYKLEGVSSMQMLRRAGHWEVADAIEKFHLNKPIQFSQIDLKLLLSLSQPKFGTIGVDSEYAQKSLKLFQDWWAKTAPEKRLKDLSFIEYFNGPRDTRSLADIIIDSEKTLMKLFLKAFPNNVNRVSAAVKQVITSSFPLTSKQINTFLKSYAGKPSLAQDHINELIDVTTLFSEIEESEAYSCYLIASRRIVSILRSHKILSMLRAVTDAISTAESIFTSLTDKKAAKAALLLRVESLDYIIDCSKSALILQKSIRCFTRRSQYIKMKAKRLAAIITIQSTARKHFVYTVARILKQQQMSIYEQLYDSSTNLIYYYNKVTNESDFAAPENGALFRPLVRDFYSDCLIQAWPQLENPKKYLVADEPADPFLCSICKNRRCVRVCIDCTTMSAYGETIYATYCFPCYSTVHSNISLEHNFKDYDIPSTESYLKCCECELPATRKCMGAISEKQIASLCEELKLLSLNAWEESIKRAKVFESPKLQLLMETIRSVSGISMSAHVQHVRGILERIQSECDECFCFDCYKDAHAGGKRAGHSWIGFKEFAPACPVCKRCPAKLRCFECEESYCSSCHKVLHGIGRKRRHKNMLILEYNPLNADFCQLCEQRVGTTPCIQNCGFMGCDSCYECVHLAQCSARSVDGNLKEKICSTCGELADTLCVDCGDLYCSRTWMGNPGCFAKSHSKGYRVRHRQQPIMIKS